MIGDIAETQEMLNFCGEHNIVADIEMIEIQQINKAYEPVVERRCEVSLCDRYGVIKCERKSTLT